MTTLLQITEDQIGKNNLYRESYMNEDPRCCGSGTCIITEDGVCWCGQQWDGKKMSAPKIKIEEITLVYKTIDSSIYQKSMPIHKELD